MELVRGLQLPALLADLEAMTKLAAPLQQQQAPRQGQGGGSKAGGPAGRLLRPRPAGASRTGCPSERPARSS